MAIRALLNRIEKTALFNINKDRKELYIWKKDKRLLRDRDKMVIENLKNLGWKLLNKERPDDGLK